MTRVEFLYFSGCPSWEQALAELRAELLAAGLDPRAVDVRTVESDEDAAREQFIGSPTIRLDGEDIEDVEGMAPALTCRLYRLADGAASALPDRTRVREALASTSEGDGPR